MQFAPATDALEASSVRYQRHHPEQTLLYQIVERYYPVFVEQSARTGAVTLIQRFGSALNL